MNWIDFVFFFPLILQLTNNFTEKNVFSLVLSNVVKIRDETVVFFCAMHVIAVNVIIMANSKPKKEEILIHR